MLYTSTRYDARGLELELYSVMVCNGIGYVM